MSAGFQFGICLTKHEFRQKDRVVSPLVAQGQSPYQIPTNHPELDMSVRTLYNYLDEEILTARNIDLKCKVKSKFHKCHRSQSRPSFREDRIRTFYPSA